MAVKSCRSQRCLHCPLSKRPLHSCELCTALAGINLPCRRNWLLPGSKLGFCFKLILPNCYWKNRESLMVLLEMKGFWFRLWKAQEKTKPKQEMTCKSWQMSRFPSICTLSSAGNKQELAQKTCFTEVLTPPAAPGFWLLLFEKLLACFLCHSSGCCISPWLSSQLQNSETTNPLSTSAFESRGWQLGHSPWVFS